MDPRAKAPRIELWIPPNDFWRVVTEGRGRLPSPPAYTPYTCRGFPPRNIVRIPGDPCAVYTFALAFRHVEGHASARIAFQTLQERSPSAV